MCGGGTCDAAVDGGNSGGSWDEGLWAEVVTIQVAGRLVGGGARHRLGDAKGRHGQRHSWGLRGLGLLIGFDWVQLALS